MRVLWQTHCLYALKKLIGKGLQVNITSLYTGEAPPQANIIIGSKVGSMIFTQRIFCQLQNIFCHMGARSILKLKNKSLMIY